MQEDKAVRFKELQKIVPVSRSTIFRWERDGLFPKHFKLGRNSTAWWLSEITAWLSNRSQNQI